ncbi:MAG: KpsF/GutQ family sugar-phosphate isomerase [Phycisphaerae bacterium]
MSPSADDIALARAELETARRTLASEGRAISALAEKIGDEFVRAVAAVHACRGKVVLTGIGKAGLVARKISATLASTGTQSIFLHPVEALHGDLGRVQRGDVAIAVSHSGRTDELLRLLDHIKARGASLIAITAEPDSPLAVNADVAVCYGPVDEACPLGVVPTVSTSCMLALGDALALSVMKMRSFTPEEFAAFHPAGSLGRRLLKVSEAMWFRRGEGLNVASDNLTLREALAEAERDVPRRSGAMLLVDADGRLSGILTDADLRRLLLSHSPEELFDRPVAELMTRNPKTVRADDLASEAVGVLNEYRVDELPVLDEDGRPVGIIDVQDLLALKTFNNERG